MLTARPPRFLYSEENNVSAIKSPLLGTVWPRAVICVPSANTAEKPPPWVLRCFQQHCHCAQQNPLVFCRVRPSPHPTRNSDCLSLLGLCNVPLALYYSYEHLFFSFKEISDVPWISPKFKIGVRKLRSIKKTEKTTPWETFWWHILLVQKILTGMKEMYSSSLFFKF